MEEPSLVVPRVIALFDIDCFFCQVESKRDPSLRGKPFVVHQHEDVISISYEGTRRRPLLYSLGIARALGVKKHEKPDDAKRRLPTLVLVSVPKGVGSKVSYVPWAYVVQN